MSVRRAIRDGHSLAEQYEALREAALAAPGRRAPGLASVRMQGLWAWVELVRAEEDAPTRRSPTPATPRTPPPVLQAELVDVWVHLALAHAEGAR